jgi:hypothetical protein
MYALRLLLYAVSFVRPVDESLLLGNDKLATHTNNYFIFAKNHPTCLGIFYTRTGVSSLLKKK